VRHELSWTHYRILSRLTEEVSRKYYIEESIRGTWSSRDLQRQISSMTYKRALKNGAGKPASPSIHDFIKDPYIFEFLQLPADKRNSERSIETVIIDHLQQFLLRFGKGFAFVARQRLMLFVATAVP
jgi:predicted nuclease of restriction endonuclease-like (RecB) superfamily